MCVGGAKLRATFKVQPFLILSSIVGLSLHLYNNKDVSWNFLILTLRKNYICGNFLFWWIFFSFLKMVAVGWFCPFRVFIPLVVLPYRGILQEDMLVQIFLVKSLSISKRKKKIITLLLSGQLESKCRCALNPKTRLQPTEDTLQQTLQTKVKNFTQRFRFIT